MDNTCCMIKCNSTNNFTGRQFYQFPADLNLCRKWVETCGDLQLLEDFTYGGVESLSTKTVCSWHFSLNDYIDPQLKRLKPNAVPKFSQCHSIKTESDDNTQVTYALIKEERLEEHNCSINTNGDSTCINNEVLDKDDSSAKLNDMSFDIESFKLLTKEDFHYIFPKNQYGIMVKLREKYKQWLRDNNINSAFFDVDHFSYISNWMAKFESSLRDSSNSTLSTPSLPPLSSLQSSSSTLLSNFTSFDLKHYLSTKNGSSVWQSYEKNNRTLLATVRDKLVKDIIQNYIDNKVFMHESDFVTITEQICSIFENETAKTYYCSTGKYPTGRLYYTYKNSASKLRKTGLFPREKRSNKKPRINTAERESDHIALDIVDDVQNWLSVYNEPWDEVLTKWQATCSLRAQQIKKTAGQQISSIIEVWPKYTHAQAAQLIDIDFEFLFPGTGNNLLHKWELFANNIIPYYKTAIKDKLNLKLLKQLEEDRSLSKNLRDTFIINLLHAVLPPTGFVKHKTTKQFWKFSIADSQVAFLKIINNFNDIQKQMLERRAKCSEFQITCQPLIFSVNFNDGNDFYCAYNNITYKCESLIHAVSTAYKIHFVFDLKYQTECNIVWQFIEEYFFDHTSNFNSVNLSSLLLALK